MILTKYGVLFVSRILFTIWFRIYINQFGDNNDANKIKKILYLVLVTSLDTK
jgi:hypothetical protein